MVVRAGSAPSRVTWRRFGAFPLPTNGRTRRDVTQDEHKLPPPRPDCPHCGSPKTQPFTHAGPGARVNMKCTNCGHLFHAKIVRS